MLISPPIFGALCLLNSQRFEPDGWLDQQRGPDPANRKEMKTQATAQNHMREIPNPFNGWFSPDEIAQMRRQILTEDLKIDAYLIEEITAPVDFTGVTEGFAKMPRWQDIMIAVFNAGGFSAPQITPEMCMKGQLTQLHVRFFQYRSKLEGMSYYSEIPVKGRFDDPLYFFVDRLRDYGDIVGGSPILRVVKREEDGE